MSRVRQVARRVDVECVAGNPLTLTVNPSGATLSSPAVTVWQSGVAVTSNAPDVTMVSGDIQVAWTTGDTSGLFTGAGRTSVGYDYSVRALVNGQGPFELVAGRFVVHRVGSADVSTSSTTVDITVGGAVVNLDVQVGASAADHIADATAAHAASAISFTPTGSVSATTVQAAIAEVDAEHLPRPTATFDFANDFGADPTGVADCTTAWNTMMAALPSVRGVVVTAVGVFRFNSAPDPVPVAIRLIGSGGATTHTRAGTVLWFPVTGTRGIEFSGNAAMSEIEDITILGSQSGTPGTDDGIVARGRIHCQRVTVTGFGRDGFSTGIDDANTNNSTFRGCRSTFNVRHGYYRQGADSNVHTYDSCSAMFNGGWAFYSDGPGASNGYFANLHSDQNGLGPVFDDGWNNVYVSVYDEFAMPVNLGTTSRSSVWIMGGQAVIPEIVNLAGEGTNGHLVISHGQLVTGPTGVARTTYSEFAGGTTCNIGGANTAWAYRVVEGALISSVRMVIGVQSGNIAVAVYRGDGTGTPAARIAASGSVACPAPGVADVSLGANVRVRPGDWICVAADNATVTFGGTTGNGTSTLNVGRVVTRGGAFPPGVTGAGFVPGDNRLIRLVGV